MSYIMLTLFGLELHSFNENLLLWNITAHVISQNHIKLFASLEQFLSTNFHSKEF